MPETYDDRPALLLLSELRAQGRATSRWRRRIVLYGLGAAAAVLVVVFHGVIGGVFEAARDGVENLQHPLPVRVVP